MLEQQSQGHSIHRKSLQELGTNRWQIARQYFHQETNDNKHSLNFDSYANQCPPSTSIDRHIAQAVAQTSSVLSIKMLFASRQKRMADVDMAPPSKRTRRQKKRTAEHFPFLKLPPEIRIMIYPMCGLNIKENLRGIFQQPRLGTPSILLVNHQVYNEAKDVMRPLETMVFTIPQHEKNFDNIIGQPSLRRLKHLSIVVQHPEQGMKEQFWPSYVAHSTNTVEQVYKWMELFVKCWKDGHNLTSFKLEFRNDRILHHLNICHRGCQVREHMRTVLKMLCKIRGIQHVELSGNVVEFYSQEKQAALNAMRRPAVPRLETLPVGIMRRIIAFAAWRVDRVAIWRQFETAAWDQVDHDSALVGSIEPDRINDVSKLNLLMDPGSPAACLRQSDSSQPSGTVLVSNEILDIVRNTFRDTLQTFETPKFEDSGVRRISRRINDICRDFGGAEELVIDQPFVPFHHFSAENLPVAKTISPFASDEFYQSVRNAVLEYRESYARNWLWKPFLETLVKVWKEQHRLHTLTLRIVLDVPRHTQQKNDKSRIAAVAYFQQLAILRGIHILQLDGPFKQSERWRLEKMTTPRRVTK